MRNFALTLLILENVEERELSSLTAKFFILKIFQGNSDPNGDKLYRVRIILGEQEYGVCILHVLYQTA